MLAERGVPLLVDLAGLRVVCVGGGRVAAGKLRGPLDAGAVVTLIAPEAVGDLVAAASAGRLTWEQRCYRSRDIDGTVLAIAATADPEVNAGVAEDARAAGVLCVRADAPATAAFLAAVRRGPLLLAVSTGGAAPALAARLRDELARAYGPEYGTLAELLGELRSDPRVRRVLDGLPAHERRLRWRSILETDILQLIRSGQIESAKEVASACLSSSSG